MKKIRSICALCLFALLLGLLMPGQAWALDADSTTVYEGIDVSVYQGDIDFQQVKEDGKSIVYIRAGEGADYTDPYFEQNARRAREAGLHFGFYLYVTARSETEAREQARFFASLIEGKGYDCRPAMDLEDFSGLSTRDVNAIGLAFLEELEERTGVRPMLYSDAYAADRIWDESFGIYPLWAANYEVREPDVNSGYWEGWSGFQYADNGRVAGIRGDVDLDRFTDSVFISAPCTPTPTPTPTPSPTPTPAPPSCHEIVYTVKAGDTLWALAQRYGTTVKAIAELNGVSNPDRIYPGQRLYIPSGQDYILYTVVSGDTLSAIALRYNTSVSRLAAINSISDPDRIYAGQRLYIPIA